MYNNIFSYLNRYCQPSSAFLCSCTAPPLCVKLALICIHQTQIAACSCQNQHSNPHSQKTKSIQNILQKFCQKKLSALLCMLTKKGQEIEFTFSIQQGIVIFENLICPKPRRRVTILNNYKERMELESKVCTCTERTVQHSFWFKGSIVIVLAIWLSTN